MQLGQLDDDDVVPLAAHALQGRWRLARERLLDHDQGLLAAFQQGGEGLLDGRSAAPFTLPAGGTEAIEVEIFSNLVSSATRLLAVVQGPTNSLEYEVQGQLTLDVALREPLGFYHRGQVPLSVAQ